MNTVVCVFIIISAATISTKRCKGRLRSGHSCRSRCNYVSGKWLRESCGEPYIHTENPPKCLTITNKECHLPFEYEGKLVKTCTLKNSSNKKPRCATGVQGQLEECSPENEIHCTELAGNCNYFCETPESDEIRCSYEFSGEHKLGIDLPTKYGNCSDENGPCHAPDACNARCVGDLITLCDTVSAEPTGCVKDGIYLAWFNGEPIEQENSSSQSLCEEKCARNPDCDAWTLNTRNGWCALKRHDQVKEEDNEGFVSGYKNC